MFGVLGGLLYAYIYFRINAHLPQPFFYEPYDTWMDWFNTAYYAHNKGAYDAWGSVYPPLSFAFLRIFGKSSCYVERNGYSARECDWVGLTTLNVILFVNVLLLYLSFRKIDRSTALFRALALGFGLPSMFGYERGNLVVLCFTCLILGFGPLLKSARLRWLFAGAAVNLKIYMVAAILPQLLRRRWRWFEGAMIGVVVVYLASYAYFQEGTPREIYDNIVYFSSLYQAATFLELWYATTYAPLVSLLDGRYQLMAGLIGSRSVDLLLIGLPALLRSAQATVLLAAAAAWARPEVVPMHRLTLLGIAMVLISAEPGGYTQGFLIFFVFMERWRSPGRCWAIICGYLLCLPYDIILDRVPPIVQESYLAGYATFFQYNVTVFPFVRPMLVLSMVVALALVTLRDVWDDVQHQDYKTRRRLRSDAPIKTPQPTPPSGPPPRWTGVRR